MPLNQNDQIDLLKDILNNHQLDRCGSVSECEQLERLVKSLMVHSDVQGELLPILEEIYDYSQGGIQSTNLDSHITTYQPKLNQWVHDMNHIAII